MLFEVKDRKGKIVRLTDIGWKHIREEHPDVKVDDIKETIEKPTKVTESKSDAEVKWYCRYDKKMKEYLMVSAKYLNGEAFIITAFYVQRIR